MASLATVPFGTYPARPRKGLNRRPRIANDHAGGVTPSPGDRVVAGNTTSERVAKTQELNHDFYPASRGLTSPPAGSGSNRQGAPTPCRGRRVAATPSSGGVNVTAPGLRHREIGDCQSVDRPVIDRLPSLRHMPAGRAVRYDAKCNVSN
jgi:hypothetical protein